MIMMKNIWFISLCAIILFHACIDDDSTLPVKAISEISIQAPSDTINLDFGFELVYEPEIEQTMEDMELSYEWSYHGYTKTSIGPLRDSFIKYFSLLSGHAVIFDKAVAQGRADENLQLF